MATRASVAASYNGCLSPQSHYRTSDTPWMPHEPRRAAEAASSERAYLGGLCLLEPFGELVTTRLHQLDVDHVIEERRNLILDTNNGGVVIAPR